MLAGNTLTVLSQHFDFCLRYVSLSAGGPFPADDDIAPAEVTAILNAGLAIMPVQHVRNPGWTPSVASGTSTGANAAANATAGGFPANVSLWMDLEEVDPTASALAIVGYCNAWYDAVLAGGFVPGVYVGAGCGLTGDQMFADLKFAHYWKSGSDVPEIPIRGYQMIQTIPPTKPVIGGIQLDIDFNRTQTDAKGGHAQWLAPR